MSLSSSIHPESGKFDFKVMGDELDSVLPSSNGDLKRKHSTKAKKQPTKPVKIFRLCAETNQSIRCRLLNNPLFGALEYQFDHQDISEKSNLLLQWINSGGLGGTDTGFDHRVLSVFMSAASDFFAEFADDFDSASEEAKEALKAMAKNAVVLEALTLHPLRFHQLLSKAEDFQFDKACLRQWLRAWIAYHGPAGYATLQQREIVFGAAYHLDASVLFSRYARLVLMNTEITQEARHLASYNLRFAAPKCVYLANKYNLERSVRSCIEWVQAFLTDERPDDQDSFQMREPRCEDASIRNVVRGFAIRKGPDGADLPMELDDVLKLGQRFRDYAENVWGFTDWGSHTFGTFAAKVMICEFKLRKLKEFVPTTTHFCLSCVKAFVDRKDKPEHVWKDWVVQPLADLCEGWHDTITFKSLFLDDQDEADAILRWRKEVHGKSWDKEFRRGPQLPPKLPKTEPFVPDVTEASDAHVLSARSGADNVIDPSTDSAKRSKPTQYNTSKRMRAAIKLDESKPRSVASSSKADPLKKSSDATTSANADRDPAVRVKLQDHKPNNASLYRAHGVDTDSASSLDVDSERNSSNAKVPRKVASEDTKDQKEALAQTSSSKFDFDMLPPFQLDLWETRNGKLVRKAGTSTTSASATTKKADGKGSSLRESAPSPSPTGSVPSKQTESKNPGTNSRRKVEPTRGGDAATSSLPRGSALPTAKTRKMPNPLDEPEEVYECPIAKAQAKAAALKKKAQAREDEKDDA